MYHVYTDAMSGAVRAKVFWSGWSQAIRVPKALRLETLGVKVERRGKSLLISPDSTELFAKASRARVSGAVHRTPRAGHCASLRRGPLGLPKITTRPALVRAISRRA